MFGVHWLLMMSCTVHLQKAGRVKPILEISLWLVLQGRAEAEAVRKLVAEKTGTEAWLQ